VTVLLPSGEPGVTAVLTVNDKGRSSR
jgi:hypothetical protein